MSCKERLSAVSATIISSYGSRIKLVQHLACLVSANNVTWRTRRTYGAIRERRGYAFAHADRLLYPHKPIPAICISFTKLARFSLRAYASRDYIQIKFERAIYSAVASKYRRWYSGQTSDLWLKKHDRDFRRYKSIIDSRSESSLDYRACASIMYGNLHFISSRVNYRWYGCSSCMHNKLLLWIIDLISEFSLISSRAYRCREKSTTIAMEIHPAICDAATSRQIQVSLLHCASSELGDSHRTASRKFLNERETRYIHS